MAEKIQSWPSLVNHECLEPYSYREGSGIITEDNDVGSPKTRQRSTDVLKYHTFDMEFTIEEWDILKSWVRFNIRGGVLTFEFPIPSTRNIGEMRLIVNEESGWLKSFKQYADRVKITVSMEEERVLPEKKELTSVEEFRESVKANLREMMRKAVEAEVEKEKTPLIEKAREEVAAEKEKLLGIATTEVAREKDRLIGIATTEVEAERERLLTEARSEVVREKADMLTTMTTEVAMEKDRLLGVATTEVATEKDRLLGVATREVATEKEGLRAKAREEVAAEKEGLRTAAISEVAKEKERLLEKAKEEVATEKARLLREAKEEATREKDRLLIEARAEVEAEKERLRQAKPENEPTPTAEPTSTNKVDEEQP
jgi:nucleoside-triphosphatase THEP1